MQTLVFIRHGLTDWNATGRWQGHTDIPLNDTGVAQARLLAERLAAWPLRAVYSSDLKRAAATADIIASPHSLKPRYLSALRERNGGLFQGLTTEEIEIEHPEEIALLRTTGMAPSVGESNLQVAQRVLKVLEQINSDHTDQMVAVVSHGGALATILAYYLGFPLGERARLSLRANTGLSIVEIDERGPVVTLLNDANHLINSEQDISGGFTFGADRSTKSGSE